MRELHLLFIGICIVGSLVPTRAGELPKERELLGGKDIVESWTRLLRTALQWNQSSRIHI